MNGPRDFQRGKRGNKRAIPTFLDQRRQTAQHDQTLVETWLFRLRRERFRSRKSGKTHDFYVTDVADGVHAIAVTADQKVVMVRQFRAGSRRDSLETPGGLLDPGEDPCVAGARELLEETGYAGDPPELLGTLWPNPALLSMRISTILIRNAQANRRIPTSTRTKSVTRRACGRSGYPRTYQERPD